MNNKKQQLMDELEKINKQEEKELKSKFKMLMSELKADLDEFISTQRYRETGKIIIPVTYSLDIELDHNIGMSCDEDAYDDICGVGYAKLKEKKGYNLSQFVCYDSIYDSGFNLEYELNITPKLRKHIERRKTLRKNIINKINKFVKKHNLSYEHTFNSVSNYIRKRT